MSQSPDQPPYVPRGACRDLFHHQDTEILLEGPAGCGKTRAVLEKVHLCALKHPGMRALLVRKTRSSMSESVLVTLEDKVLPPGTRVIAGLSRRMRQAYVYPNGSTLVTAGVDKTEKIMSTEFDLIAAFEATELVEQDWERLLTRLRNGAMPYQQAIADCNPAHPGHWLNRRAHQGGMTRLPVRHEDNPTLHDGETWTPAGEAYLARLERLTGPRYRRLREGAWAAAEGLVYPQFDPVIHVCRPFAIPPHWRRIRSIDFGYSNPFVCQWWAIDGDGRLYLYRELYHTQRLVADHAQQILARSQGEAIETTLSDHDAEDRATLERGGIPTLPAHKPIRPGLEAVASRLRLAPDGRPRLFLLSDSLVERDPQLTGARRPACTREELELYRYPANADGANRQAAELPLKQDDHAMDAMRYAVAHADALAQGGVTLDVRFLT